jgi:hypothetical protein
VTVGAATGASDLVFRTISYYTLYSVSFLSSFTHLYFFHHKMLSTRNILIKELIKTFDKNFL